MRFFTSLRRIARKLVEGGTFADLLIKGGGHLESETSGVSQRGQADGIPSVQRGGGRRGGGSGAWE